MLKIDAAPHMLEIGGESSAPAMLKIGILLLADEKRGEVEVELLPRMCFQPLRTSVAASSSFRPLGAPLEPATRDGLVFTRRFEHVDVMVDLENKQAKLEWRLPVEAAKSPPMSGLMLSAGQLCIRGNGSPRSMTSASWAAKSWSRVRT